MRLMLTLVVVVLVVGNYAPALAQDELTTIKAVLNSPRRDWNRDPWQEHAEDLEFLGDRALPLLASLLPDYDLGYQAAKTMLVIAPEKAAPLLFAAIPPADRNVQNTAFDYFLPRLYLADGSPLAREMHDAAVRCLKAGTNADAAELALLVIGLTGGEDDYPLLESYYENHHPTEYWRIRLANAAESALARLGSQVYLDSIQLQLSAPVPAGLTEAEAYLLDASMRKAGFSRNQRFIPILCRHLQDPAPADPGRCVRPTHPAGSAQRALDQIINNASPDALSPLSPATTTDWKQWCVAHVPGRFRF